MTGEEVVVDGGMTRLWVDRPAARLHSAAGGRARPAFRSRSSCACPATRHAPSSIGTTSWTRATYETP